MNQNDKIFAALKLLEALYQKGMIPKHVFKNILDEHKSDVDLSQFKL